MERFEEILHYWFGPLKDEEDYPQDKAGLWFKKSEETDQFISENFKADVLKAGHDEFEDWKLSPRGTLGFIILLDQFTRNIFRNKPESFAYDHKSLSTTLKAIEKGFDSQLALVERIFLYLPLEHSEDVVMQRKAVEMFQKLLTDAPMDQKERYEGYLEYAHRHTKIIERFDRFPHRNQILGRDSTPEEIEFLTQPGSSF